MKTRNAVIAVSWVLLLVNLSGAGPAAAGEQKSPENKFYLSALSHYSSFRGELDGRMVLGDLKDIFYVPKLESHYGFGLSFGSKVKGGMWEIIFLRSKHQTRLQDRDSDSSFQLFEANGKAFLAPEFPVRPCLLLGFCIPWINVKEAARKNRIAHDALYFGLGINAGGGVVLNITPRLFLCGTAVYRFLGILMAKGSGRVRDLTNLYYDVTGPRRKSYLKANSLCLEISLSFFL